MSNQGFDQQTRRYEQWLDRYVIGLDTGDAEAVAEVLTIALDDAELGRLIDEINLAYEDDERLAPLADEARKVRELARQHLPSAFENEDDSHVPVTIGEIAAILHAKRRVPFADVELNRSLLSNSAALPHPLNLPAVRALFAELDVRPSQRFIRMFYDTAITLSIARSHNQALLAARKQQTRPKQGKQTGQFNKNESEEK
jgi:hypothetical protein